MEWADVLSKIFELVIFPLLGIATSYLIYWLKTKIAALKQQNENVLLNKYLGMLDKTITEAVLATNQTYVEALKKSGEFDWEAQQAAFQETYDAVVAIVAPDALEFLQTAMGDLQLYITNKIESEVLYQKN